MKVENYTYLNDQGYYHRSGAAKSIAAADLDILYKELGIDYPKFYKMDPLCKLGFLLCEPLKTSDEISSNGIFIWNKHSSFDADFKHTQNIKNNMPGPANFSYTLPNIVAGEVAIRHKITGECGIFIVEDLDFAEMSKSISLYFDNPLVSCLWVGWIDAKAGKCIGFMCKVVKDNSNIGIFSAEIERIYKGLFI